MILIELYIFFQALYKNQDNYIEVPKIPNSEVVTLLDSWLSAASRSLTTQQKANVLSAFTNCAIPIVLKLNFNEAKRWASYDPLNETILTASIFAAIQNLFERLERKHGKLLIQYALGCLTACKFPFDKFNFILI